MDYFFVLFVYNIKALLGAGLIFTEGLEELDENFLGFIPFSEERFKNGVACVPYLRRWISQIMDDHIEEYFCIFELLFKRFHLINLIIF